MSIRDDLLKVVDEARNLHIEFDDAPQVTIRVRRWTGGEPDNGAHIDKDLVLPRKFRAKHLKAREIAGSGGLYQLGDIAITHITPKSSDGLVGYSEAELHPRPKPAEEGFELLYLLSGSEHAGIYTFVDANFIERGYSYRLVLRRSRRSP